MNKIKKIYFSFGKKERVIFWAALTSASVSFLILSWIYVKNNTAVVPARGGKYTEGMVGQPSYVNPVIAETEVDKSLVVLLFSSLADLAQKVEVENDGRLYKVRLKENIFWSDGEKITSDDVIFTVQKIQDAENFSPLFGSWQGIAANRLSELEIQFNIANPYAFFAENLSNLYIIPKHIFADVPFANWKLSEYNLKPIGSGPYKFEAYEKRSDGFITTYRLKSNPYYFKNKPFIEKFIIKFFPRTEDLLEEFNSAKIDGYGSPDPLILRNVKRPSQVISFFLPSYYAVFINQTQNIALKEIEVRKALEKAINKKELIDQILGGRGKIAPGPVPPYTSYLDDALLKEENKPSAAEILEEAGWKINEKGGREKEIKKDTKIKLEFNLTVPQIEFMAQTAELLKTSWEKAGFRINIVKLPAEEIINTVIKNRNYELLLFGNILNTNPDLFSFWHSSERFYPGLNLTLYNNKKVDSLIESIRQNMDKASRLEQFKEVQNIIAKDYPAIFLYSPDYLHITNKNLKGVKGKLIAEPAERLSGANEWYLKTTRTIK